MKHENAILSFYGRCLQDTKAIARRKFQRNENSIPTEFSDEFFSARFALRTFSIVSEIFRFFTLVACPENKDRN